jgi:Na+-translocating ferredoxin:NAD+ oxidoreductase subunit B
VKKEFIKEIALFLTLFLGTLIIVLKAGFLTEETGAWGIDKSACVGCGGCATQCVLPQSAVVAVIDQDICTGKDDCPAYFKRGVIKEGRENQNCPTGALKRTENGDGTFTYTIDSSECIGCGKCTSLCQRRGDGALSLVIDSEQCVDCNQCQIGQDCPTDAIHRSGNEE